METFIVCMFLLFVAAAVLGIYGYAKATPEQRQKINEQMQKAGQEMNGQMQQWKEERRQAKAYKRARNAACWEIGKKIIERL